MRAAFLQPCGNTIREKAIAGVARRLEPVRRTRAHKKSRCASGFPAPRSRVAAYGPLFAEDDHCGRRLHRTSVVLFTAAAFRLLVAINLPIWLRHTRIDEDGLYLRLAASLASGHWLGPYDPLTLTRGPGYPVFLALSSLSGLPVSAAHALFQIAAIAVAAWAVYRLTASKAIAASMFVVLAFDPIGFMPDMQCVMAEQITWAQLLLVFSLAAVLLYAPPQQRRNAIVLGALLGIILAWTWLTWEYGIVLLLGLLLLAAGSALIRRGKQPELSALAGSVAAAGVAFLAVILLVMSANLVAYGTFSAFQSKVRDATAPEALPGALEAVGRRVAFLDAGDASAVPATVQHIEPETFARYWVLLNRPFVSEIGKKGLQTSVDGWYYDTQSTRWPSFAVFDHAGAQVPFSLKRKSSPDLQVYFHTERPAWNRFLMTYQCPDSCTVVVRAFDRPELRLPIDRERGFSASVGSATLYVDVVRTDWYATADLRRLQVLAAYVRSGLILFYQLLTPLLVLAGLVALIAAIDGSVAARTLNPLLLIAATAWLLVGMQIVCLALTGMGAAAAATVSNTAIAAYLAVLATFLSFGAVAVQARPKADHARHEVNTLRAETRGKPAA